VENNGSGPRYKILVISDYRAVSASRPEAEIFIRLARQGYSVHILSYPEAEYYNKRFRENRITVIEKHPLKKISFPFISYLRAHVVKEKYDFVHVFNSQGLTNAVWALIGVQTKLIAYRGYAGQTHWFDPVMYTKYFHPRVDHIICVSKDIMQILGRNMPGGRSKLSVILKGHDPAWYQDIKPIDRKELGLAKDDIVVCFLANVRPFKGLSYLIKATHLVSGLSNLHIVFIGLGYDVPSVQQEMDRSPMRNRFHILGFRPDAIEVMASSDALISASTHGEGLSKAVVESMCLGLAPIITAIPGHHGLVEDGQSGWVIPAKDPGAIAAALSMMASDQGERKRRGRKAKERIFEHLHINRTVEAFERLYQQLREVRG
jgi:glycosyltransferase involved in cell wall biosynthesis